MIPLICGIGEVLLDRDGVHIYSGSKNTNILSGHGQAINIGNSGAIIQCKGQLFDKNGNEITGGSGGLVWYHETRESPYTVDIASNIVTLRSGGDTAGMIMDDTMLKLENGIHINTTIGDYSSKNILSTEVWPDNSFFIILGGQNAPIMCNGTLYGFGGGENAAIEADSDTGGCNYFRMIASAWDYQTSISLSSVMGTGSITLAIGSTTLELTEEKLQKLKQWLES